MKCIDTEIAAAIHIKRLSHCCKFPYSCWNCLLMIICGCCVYKTWHDTISCLFELVEMQKSDLCTECLLGVETDVKCLEIAYYM